MDAPRPRPHPGWVVLRVAAVGICGSELGGYLGHNELRKPPLVMGHEFSGIVEEVGEGVEGVEPGRLVTANPLVSCGSCRHCRSGNRQLCARRKIIGIDYPGAFAEWVAVPASAVYPVPDPVLGALVEPFACALRAVRLAEVEVGDEALVIGAGIIGLMTAKALGLAGARRVIVADPNSRRREAARAWGASDLAETVLTGVSDLDVVVDAVGFGATRRDALGVLRRGGRLVWIGLHENETTLPGNGMVRDEVTVRGSFCYRDEEFARAVALITEGSALPTGREWLDVRPLASGDEAFREQAEGPAPFAKIVLTV